MTDLRRRAHWVLTLCAAVLLAPVGSAAQASAVHVGVAAVAVPASQPGVVGLTARGGPEHVAKPDLVADAVTGHPSAAAATGARPQGADRPAQQRAVAVFQARGPPAAATRAASRGSTP